MTNELFVAVATWQNVANLPPILELAKPGDRVVWLESTQAQQGNWTAGANAVFRRLDLEVGPPVAFSEINNPTEVARACQMLLREAGSVSRIYVVAKVGLS